MIGDNKMFLGFSETSMNLGFISLTFLLISCQQMEI